MYSIIHKKVLNNVVDQIQVEAPLVALNCKPGNFVIVRVKSDSERVPLTVVSHDKTSITLIYQKLGFSTKQLGELSVGDQISDVVGPLGEPIKIHKIKSLLAIAGGVGAAPIYPQLKLYHDEGVNITLILGAKTKEYLLLVDEFEHICDSIYYSTDDGSYGKKGFVTDVQRDILTSESFDHSIVIGPLIMMKNAVDINKIYGLKTDVSLNPIMIDGTGMCGNCRVTINNNTYFACVDGPDFPGENVNFDELIERQNYYKDEEEHICNLELSKNEKK
jgi:ferredoxin--NADP+ reductase